MQSPGPDFRERPWPERSPGDSPYLAMQALVAWTPPGRNLAFELTQAGLPARFPEAGETLAQALVRCRPDLLVCDPASLEGLPPTTLPRQVFLLGNETGAPRPDCVHLPVDATAAWILETFGRTLEQELLRVENERLRAALAANQAAEAFESADPEMRRILAVAGEVARTRATVLLLGESGTGKTRLAQTLHEHSDRAEGPFQVVHCGALPPDLLESELFGHAKGAFTGAVLDRAGRFEQADGGSIFLDEIQSAPLDLQVKLLRVLQERRFERVGESRTREVDVRILAASNQDLRAAITRGEFREDLYWRLNVVSLELPPLRRRPQDLARLCEGFLRRFARQYNREDLRFDTAVWQLFQAYPWPGNIRQLENAVERCVLLTTGPWIHLDALPAELQEFAASHPQEPVVAPSSLVAGLQFLEEVLPLKQALEGPERAILVHALRSTGGNRSRAAELLDINRTTLFHKMRKHGLMEDSFGSPA